LTERDGKLAALTAAFANERAPALLSRLAGSCAVAAVEAAGRLAAAPRERRLVALAAALSGDADGGQASADAAAALERPRVAAVLRALGAGALPPGASPSLVRLCRERMGR
jgi:hypothetical protein